MVCLGNICRSPMAEAILRRKLALRGLTDWVVDSAGTSGHHAGESADPRTLAVLRRRGAACELVSRQVCDEDFVRFDVLLAMDRSNLRALERRCPPEHRHKLRLVREPVGGGEVPDPYYGGPDGFDHVYDLLDEALEAWLERWGAAEGRRAGA